MKADKFVKSAIMPTMAPEVVTFLLNFKPNQAHLLCNMSSKVCETTRVPLRC